MTAYAPSRISFDPEKATLLLGVPKEALALEAIQKRADEDGFEFKKEFHITVIGYGVGRLIKEWEAAIRELIDSTNWEFSPEPVLYRIRKQYVRAAGTEEREAYMQKVSVPQLQGFYERLSEISGLKLEAPPSHVTLCVKGSGAGWRDGIGIATNEELERCALEKIELRG